MTESLQKKKKVRGGHKGHTSRVIIKVKGTLEGFDETHTEELLDQLQNHRQTLTEKLETLKVLDEAIVELVKDEEIYVEIEESENFKFGIHDTIRKIDSKLKRLKKSEANTGGIASAQAEGALSSSVQVKLPKINLRKFNGDPCSWVPFFDSFQATVDKNPNLATIDKFNYLRGLLEGPALATIAGITLSDVNYQQALDLLKNRFANPQLIISSHMESLYKLKEVDTVHDVQRVRNLYDKIESNIRGLMGLGINKEQYGPMLIPLMMGKIPSEFRLMISRKFEKGTWDINGLLETFRTELEAREHCEVVSTKPNQRDQGQGHGSYTNRQRAGPISAAALITTNKKQLTCTFRKQGHASSSCNIITDIGARKNVLHHEERCFICLKCNHVARNCSSNIKCHECGQRHHISVCTQITNTSLSGPTSNTSFAGTSTSQQRTTYVPITKSQVRSQGNVESQQRVTSNQAEAAKRSETSHQVQTVTLVPNDNCASQPVHVRSNTSVLLQTAKALVTRVDCNEPAFEAQVLLDTGSQRSYINTHLREALGLPAIRSDTLIRGGFRPVQKVRINLSNN